MNGCAESALRAATPGPRRRRAADAGQEFWKSGRWDGIASCGSKAGERCVVLLP